MAKIPPTGVGKTLFYSAQGPLDYREYIDNLEEITSLYSAYVGLEVKCGDGNKYRITEVDLLGHPTQNGYELIQEPKDLKYSDDTSFLNSDNEIDIDTLKLKNIPELLPHPMLDGFYYTISNNTPWEGQILTTPIYHINNQYLEISIPSVSPKPSNLGEFSLSLINAYSELEGKQFEISIFNINKCSNGYLSSNSSYKFKIPLDTTSDKTVIETEDGINLECGIGILTNYLLTVSLPENEPNISDYRVVLSFSNIQDVSGKIDKISNSTNGNLPKLNSEGNLVDSGISADSILTKVTGTNLNGKLAILDTNGNITNSGKSLSDLRAELDNEYVPKSSTDPSDGQILSYDKTNETTKWIDNTKVHIKYAATDTPTSNDMHDSIQPGDLYIGIYSDNNLSDSTTYTDYEWSKIVGIDGTNGKSAYQQWLEAGYTGDETDFLNSLKAHVAGFQRVDYNSNAPTTIGGTASAIGSLSPSADTMDKIVLMPNSDGTATIMYATTATESGGVTTYAFSCIGELDIDTSNFLSSSSVDSTNLKNPTTSQVAKATDVMQLAAKLEGVTAVETKQAVADWHPDGESSGYYNTSKVWTPNSNFLSTRISVNGYNKVRFIGYNKSFTTKYAYGFLDADSQPIGDFIEYYKATIPTERKCVLEVEVPVGASYFVCLRKAWSSSTDYQMFQESEFYCYLQSGENVEDMIESSKKDVLESVYGEAEEVWISAELGGTKNRFSKIADSDGYILKRLNSSLSKYVSITSAFDKIEVTSNSYQPWITFLRTNLSEIDWEDKEGYTWDELREDEYLCEIHLQNGYSVEYGSSTSNGIKLLDIPDDCKTIVFSYHDSTNSIPKSVRLFKIERTGGDLREIENDVNKMDKAILPVGIVFKKGEYKENGEINTSELYAYSSPISYGRPFYIELHGSYEFHRVRVFDANNNLVTYNERVHTSKSHINSWGLALALPQYYARIEVRRVDGKAIDVDDNIVKRFYNFDGYKRVIPSHIPTACWNIFHQRIMQLVNATWFALNNITQGKASKSKYFFLSGSQNRGIAYSECSKYSKYVGQYVSFRTYLTSLLNKRSVMYTEDLHANNKPSENRNRSSYGLNYEGRVNLTMCYYGTVCTGLASYVLGIQGVVTSTGWAGQSGTTCIARGKRVEGAQKYEVKINNEFVEVDNLYELIDTLLPGDVIVTPSHHAAVISDMYLDDEEKIKFIYVAEQTTPRGCITPYPKEKFKDRLAGYLASDGVSYRPFYIYRQSAETWQERLTSVANFETDIPYVQMNRDDYSPELLKIDPDITTFAGEYVAFTTNKSQAELESTLNNHKAFLNIRKGDYNKLQIFNEDDNIETATPIEVSIVIDGANTPWIGEDVTWNGDGTSYIYDDHADWFVIDLKKMIDTNNNAVTFAAGRYKARLANNDGTKKSGFTHWEMIGVEVTPINPQQGQITESFNFSCSSNATPYKVAWEGTNFLSTRSFFNVTNTTDPTQNVYFDSSINKWVVKTPNNNVPYYIKVYFRGAYGDVVVAYPTNGSVDYDDDGDDPNTEV